MRASPTPQPPRRSTPPRLRTCTPQLPRPRCQKVRGCWGHVVSVGEGRGAVSFGLCTGAGTGETPIRVAPVAPCEVCALVCMFGCYTPLLCAVVMLCVRVPALVVSFSVSHCPSPVRWVVIVCVRVRHWLCPTAPLACVGL